MLKIFQFAKWNKSKEVTFLEFFSANLDFKKSITEEQIKFVFDQIDINDNESVSLLFPDLFWRL